jgi:hypothetical protein
LKPEEKEEEEEGEEGEEGEEEEEEEEEREEEEREEEEEEEESEGEGVFKLWVNWIQLVPPHLEQHLRDLGKLGLVHHPFQKLLVLG